MVSVSGSVQRIISGERSSLLCVGFSSEGASDETASDAVTAVASVGSGERSSLLGVGFSSEGASDETASGCRDSGYIP